MLKSGSCEGKGRIGIAGEAVLVYVLPSVRPSLGECAKLTREGLMSFRTSGPATSSAFQLVRDSLLQAEGLPFSEALTAEHIEQAFDAEGVSFAREDGCGNEPVYTPAVTLWAMLSQALFTDEQRSCVAAVIRVAVFYVLSGRTISTTNTGAYSRARAKVPEGIVRRLAIGVAERSESAAAKVWKWLGRTVRIADGTTLSMPDTPANQAAYPQALTQAAGVGFPVLRCLALISLATGMVSGLATAPYAGKETGETALLRELFDHLQQGEVLLGDRYYCGWFMLALLRQLGVDFVIRLQHGRQADFRRGRRLGPGDHVVAWTKPKRPEWLDRQTFDSLPSELEVREVQVNVQTPGFRTQTLVVVTSLLHVQEVSAVNLSDLYRKRWSVELRLREVKDIMQFDVLRRKTPERVRQELWTGLLAYNLIRQSMLQSALKAGRVPWELSFTATLQMIANTWLLAAVFGFDNQTDSPLLRLRLSNSLSHLVGQRPNRVEPRAIKRRPPTRKRLQVPRAIARAALLAGAAEK